MTLSCTECDMAPYLTTPCQIQTEDDILPLLSLDQPLDPRNKKFSVAASTVILSRVWVNYLSSKATFSDWSICVRHKVELLDDWSPGDQCCHHHHVDTDQDQTQTMGKVTYAMSKTILKTDGMVLPIGGVVCKVCKDNYVKQYIPALTSIKDIKENEKPSPAPETSPSAMSPAEIQRRLSSLTPVPMVFVSPPPVIPSPQSPSTPAAPAPPSETISVTVFTDNVIDVITDTALIIKEEVAETEASAAEPEASSTETRRSSTRTPSPNKRQNKESRSSISKESDQDEYKYFCKLCHIGFLKESSYKYHIANNVELHNKAKTQKNKVKKCNECDESFSNDNLFRKHLYNEHKMDDPHFCKLCDIVLKSESAYKSHYSKLHLERRTKIFYCRECGDIFNCKVDHQEHIVSHMENVKDSHSQCLTCGKVFGIGNRNAYIKHLSTHDDESQKPCDCPNCDEDDGKSQVADGSIKKRKSSRRSSPRKSKIRKIAISEGDNDSDKESNVDDPDSADEFQVNCGVCGTTFNNIEELEKHIDAEHNKKQTVKSRTKLFVAKEGGWKCNLCGAVLRTSRELQNHKSKKECPVLKEADKNTLESTNDESVENSTKSRLISNGSWQQSESRNWAAEFGCSSRSNDDEEEEELSTKSKPNKSTKTSHETKLPMKPKDILSAMKLNFGGVADDESEDEDDEVEESYLRTKDGRTNMQNREPRTLSKSSRQTRERLELLTKQAQEKMKDREKTRAAKRMSKGQIDSNSPAAKKSVNNNQIVELSSSEDEDLNADISNNDNLLIPLANGWVCEKTRDKSSNNYKTHYWSPDNRQFNSLAEIKTYAKNNRINVDIEAFNAANIEVGNTDKSKDDPRMSTVRVKDEETGLPMVVIFPGGRDCLTMDVSATA